MKNPGKISKKSLTYIRPEMGRFTLEALPGVELRFRKFDLDDYAWVESTFGRPLEQLSQPGGEGVMTSTLARIWFRVLDEESKSHFPPKVETVIDYESTGEKQEITVPGWQRFMRAISVGEARNKVNMAFTVTMMAGKSLSDIPDTDPTGAPSEFKKKVMEWVANHPA